METSVLSPTSQLLLHHISTLDSLGANEWNLRIISLMSATFFLGMRKQVGHKYQVDWDGLVHATITGFGSAACIYLNIYAAVHMTGMPEPMASVQCKGALTSLHRIIPSITQGGYAICDIINGLRLGPTFLAHGLFTFVSTLVFNELDASHILTPFLVMEISTIILTVLRADFFTPTIQLISQASFALSFFLIRVLLVPYLSYGLLNVMSSHLEDCFPRLLFYVTCIAALFFNGLNLFWFTKLVQKIQRKLSGQEKMTDMKDLDEEMKED